jgi:hypothetical protein
MYFLSSSLNDNWMLLYFKFEHAPPKHYVDTKCFFSLFKIFDESQNQA